jgi:hypothetical protein
MSGQPRKTVRVSNTARVRNYNFLYPTAHIANASRNRFAPTVSGKNARGKSAHIPQGNTRISPMYLPNNTGRIFKSTNAMTGNAAEFRNVSRRSKNSLRAGENVPTMYQTRRALSKNEQINKANKTLAIIEHATYRNTGVNTTHSQIYNNLQQSGENMENVIRSGEQAYIASGLENVAHARRTAELNQRTAEEIAVEAAAAALPLRRLPGRRNLLGRRSHSARKTRRGRRA